LTRTTLLLAGFLWCAPAVFAAATDHPDAKRETPIATGDLAPDFTLEDQDGRAHSLSAQRGKQPVVLVFYRGYW
jgi:cytochrome oxidase Cu insertion factor (SCO1/SenC/PrrC family)